MRFVDIFCGAGGFSQGAAQAGLKHVFGVDMNPNACETYRRNCGRSVCKSVLDVSDEELRELARTDVDIVLGSPPCQGISSVGKTPSTPHKNDMMFKEVVRVAKALNAKAVVIENVVRLLNKKAKDGGTLADHLKRSLDAAGYHVYIRALNAADYEVPQRRVRAFIVGIAKTCDAKFDWPAPHSAPALTFGSVMHASEREVDAAIEAYGYDVRMSAQKLRYYVDRKQERPEYVRFVDPEQPAATVRAGYLKSRGADALIAVGLDGKLLLDVQRASQVQSMRMMTIPEVLAVQTFPPDYDLAGSVGSMYEQVGNAVPVKLAYHVCAAAARCLKAANRRAARQQ
jgi:DNA (cytosine-5)-methyltransferase 1